MPILTASREVLALLDQLRAATGPQEVLGAVHNLTSATAGLNVYAAWRVPVFRTGMTAFKLGLNVFPGSTVPASYWDDFQALARVNGSSAMSQFALLHRKPITLTEAMRALAPTGRSRWLPDLLRKFKIRDLFYCPVGRWMIVFWSGRIIRVDWETRAAIHEVAHYAAHRLDELVLSKKIDGSLPHLSARELEILRLASLGLRAAQIAGTLDIAVPTVRSHLARITKKLGAKSVLHAACQALRLGLIV